MSELRIYNTLTNSKDEFVPVDKNHVRMYTCGPTVYNYAHIGNARPAVVSDLLIRLLRHLYPKVTFVSNITDIDDKIIKAAKEVGKPINELTVKFEKIYNEDMRSLNVQKPDMQPRATEYIDNMIDLIKKMIDNGFAYESESHVLFDVTSYDSYGKLSGRDREDQIAGSRVEVASYKKDPGDFVLWKPSLGDDPGWDSPWGYGRPGWHLECSAMSEASLGLPFDIHGGGMDLIFPHHENEIAQSCGAHNEQNNPAIFAKYWIHNAMLNIDGKKMSKSLGNIFYIRDYLEEFNGEVLRLALLSGHYRQPLNWTKDSINQSKNLLDKIYRLLKKVENVNVEEVSKEHIPQELIDALCDDLNTSKGLAVINSIVNKLSKADNDDDLKKYKLQLLASGNMYGILNENPDSWLGVNVDTNSIDVSKIEALLSERELARKNRDFQRADEIRDELEKLGISIEDSPSGTTWRKA